MKILDILDEESISGESSGYKFDEKSYRECESIAKVRFKFFLVHKHIYIHTIYIYMDTNTNHFNPLTLCVRGN